MRSRLLLLIIAGVCVATLVFAASRYCCDRVCEPDTGKSSAGPQRIVSLAPNLTEILFALGLGGQIVAVSSDSDYPPEAADRTKTGTFWDPDIEAIAASKPDLVFALQIQRQEAIADSLLRMGHTVVTLKIERVDQLFTAIEQIGAATGCDVRAARLNEEIRDQISTLRSQLDQIERTKVLWVVQSEPLRVVGRDTFINEMIELAGGQNAIGPTISRYPPIGAEEILVCNADVVIHSAMGESSIEQQQQAAREYWSKYENLPAVKNNRIFVVSSDAVLRLGPRLPEGLKLIAEYLHGEL